MFSLPRISRTLILCALTLSVITGCHRIDDDRLPPVPVNIVFTTEGMWSTYGVGGAMQSRRFIKSTTNPEPRDFPYTVSTYTGYGGVLLASDIFGNPIAYDLSCPYEAKPDIRVNVDNEENDAVCPVCGSTYDIFAGEGRPTSGPSADRGYGLTRYRVLITNQPLNYCVITR